MLLRELFEAPAKTAVLAFGRLNPPTIGHAKLVDAITAQEGDHYLFLSQTQKPKTDPLDFATKMKLAKQFFPGVNVGHQAVRTPVQALEQLQSLGYTDIIFIAGSDRVDGFQKLFDTYNGQADKAGNVPFKFNSIKVVSAGERDPDADGAEGMSASKMRAAAAEGNLEAFAQGVPDKKLAQTMYDAVRKGMGVNDTVPTENIVEFDIRSNKGFEQLDNYENYEIYRTKKKFKDQYFIAQAIHPRTREIIAKASDESRNGAEVKIHAELDKLSSERKRVTGNATVDFNVEFARQILSEPGETFYAKIISGPKLVIAGAEMLEYPEIMKDEGFKKSAIRNVNSPEGTTRLPSIPLGAKQASAANVVANGRYLVGNQSKDKDENLVFDLNFDSEVYSKGDKVRIKKPALTIGTNRNESFDEENAVQEWAVPALKGGKYAFQIAKFFWNNKWAIGFLTVSWKTYRWINDAIAWIKPLLDNPIVRGLSRYGLPAVAIAVALYGGKKLYDELVNAQNEKDLEKIFKNFEPDRDELDELKAEIEKMLADKKTNEKAPPGREKQVKALKKKFDDPSAPYAIAWAQHNKRGKPKKEQLDIDGMLDEILGFATKRPKTNTVKRRPPEPEQDSVQDKIKQRRALASKVGTDKAFRHDSLKGK